MPAGDGTGTTWREGLGRAAVESVPAEVLETLVSPFHCLYQDALEFHQQARLRAAHSDAESSRLARAAVVLYVAAAEALVHQAAAELGRPELARLICDRRRPVPLEDAWRLLPLCVGESPSGYDPPEAPPWPQFCELLELRRAWAYPGVESERRAYYIRRVGDASGSFRPLEPRDLPPGLRLSAEQLIYPRTGLPRDPYALRAYHLDTVRGILDAAIEALDRRLGGLLTREGRHRREPCRMVYPATRG
ncbi:MAG: hypothetical protein KatS3mg108_0407 [Isosphaeraceae bacterium]|nr:MAG: hypothetical protein KatS3mg108_0407 [Isosphaeraceae bacterium]